MAAPGDKVISVDDRPNMAGAFLLMLLACLVNPYGWERFYPPLFQDRLESIRAYVGEMEPLDGGLATIYG